jgi:hypothetical protein
MMIEIGAPEICRAQWFEMIATALGKRKNTKACRRNMDNVQAHASSA